MKRVTKKSRVNFTEDAIIELMEETYNDIIQEKTKALTAYKDYKAFVKDSTDVGFAGKVTVDLLKIIDNAIDKKLKLIKLQTDYMLKMGKVGVGGDGEQVAGKGLTDDDKKEIEAMLERNGFNLNGEKEYN